MTASPAVPQDKVVNKAITPSAVIGKDDVVFVRDENTSRRQAKHAEAAKVLRSALVNRAGIAEHVIALMTFLLVTGTTTDAGDALDILAKDGGLPEATAKDKSMARAAAYAVETFGIASTADDRWPVVLTTVRRVGRGKAALESVLKGKRDATKNKVMAGILSAPADEREQKIREAFPTTRQSDGTTGSAAWNAIEAAKERIGQAANKAADKGGLTDAERETVVDGLRALATLVKSGPHTASE